MCIFPHDVACKGLDKFSFLSLTSRFSAENCKWVCWYYHLAALLRPRWSAAKCHMRCHLRAGPRAAAWTCGLGAASFPVRVSAERAWEMRSSKAPREQASTCCSARYAAHPPQRSRDKHHSGYLLFQRCNLLLQFSSLVLRHTQYTWSAVHSLV